MSERWANNLIHAHDKFSHLGSGAAELPSNAQATRPAGLDSILGLDPGNQAAEVCYTTDKRAISRGNSRLRQAASGPFPARRRRISSRWRAR